MAWFLIGLSTVGFVAKDRYMSGFSFSCIFLPIWTVGRQLRSSVHVYADLLTETTLGSGRDSKLSTFLAEALIKDLTVPINHTHLGPSAVRDLE